MDRLFAFDNFIRNSDRGSHKPNLLLTVVGAYLIDREYALDLSETTIEQIELSILPGKFSTTHIAFPVLADGNAGEKASYFHDFCEYLRVLHLEDFHRILLEVENHGYHTDIGTIMEYFRFIKSNPQYIRQSIEGGDTMKAEIFYSVLKLDMGCI